MCMLKITTIFVTYKPTQMSKTYFASRLINLKKLSELSGISYYTLINYKVGRAGSKGLDRNVETKLANAIARDLKPMLEALGFSIDITRKD